MAELIFDSGIEKRNVQHTGPLDGGSRITGIMLPDSGGIINGDAGDQLMTDAGDQRVQLLCIIVIALLRHGGFIQRQPFKGIITDGQFLAKELTGFFFFDISVPEVIRLL